MESGKINADAVTTVRSILGESPLWVEGTGLWWLDIEAPALHLLRDDGQVRSMPLSRTVTAIELTAGPGLLAVTRRGFGRLDPCTGEVTEDLIVLDDDALTLNDAAIGPDGRCWTGVATFDHSDLGTLYRYDAGTATAFGGGVAMSNGIDWSPSGETMYHVDSLAGTVTAWYYDSVTGAIDEPATLVTVDPDVGVPDGLAVDAEGGLWLAVWGAGAVWRIDPHTGRTTWTVTVPTPNATSCAFGGPDLRTLYITTAADGDSEFGGLVYAAEADAKGSPPRRYRPTRSAVPR